MRRVEGLVCLAIILVATAGAARADEHVYVRAGDAHEWATTQAPLPEFTIGAYAAKLMRRAPPVAAAAAAEQQSPLPQAPPQAPPQPPAVQPALAYQAAAPLPLTLDTTRARVAALYLRRTFTVGA